jgi:hypothetical protein
MRNAAGLLIQTGGDRLESLATVIIDSLPSAQH